MGVWPCPKGKRAESAAWRHTEGIQAVGGAPNLELAERLAKALSEELGFPIEVAIAGGQITLSGVADSAEARVSAAESVAGVVPGMPVQNNITIAEGTMMRTGNGYADENRPGDTKPPMGSESIEAAHMSDLDAGFTDQPLETNEITVANDSIPDLDEDAEPDPTFFAPTDPVLKLGERGGADVLGGFTPTSDTSDEVDLSVEDHQPGDESIADAVRRELQEDALTTDLPIEVVVERGVVHLQGSVPSQEEAEGAQDVASRVPGVREVLDELELP